MSVASSPYSPGSVELLGRETECATLDNLLADARRGNARALVIGGEAGAGKTALLDYLLASAAEFTVLQATGVDSEMELAYASLHQLCAPLLHQLDGLPAPQRVALEVVFGISVGPPPGRFLVGLALLSLLVNAARTRAVLCLVDDAQWLDESSAQVLTFVARRLGQERLGMVFAAREPAARFQGLEQLTLSGLHDQAARGVLAKVVPFKLDAAVRERIIAEVRGNPLALLELPRGLGPTELADGFGLLAKQGLSARIEESYVARLGGLSAQARQALLLAAADPTGDRRLLQSAVSQELGVDVETIEGEADGLLVLADRVTFHHPLVRSAVYRSAPIGERRAAHLALARATDPVIDPDRRAWHRGVAASGPDESVASQLERSADRAKSRGGFASAATLLQRSAALTDDAALRGGRVLAAAEASFQAGAFDAAARLLAAADEEPLTDYQSACVDLTRAQIAFSVKRGGAASSLLLKAAERLSPLDPLLARDTYLEALYAAIFAGRMSPLDNAAAAVAKAARSAPAAPDPPRPSDLLLDGYAIAITEGYAAAAPVLKAAVAAFNDSEVDDEYLLRWGLQAASAALVLWDEDAWIQIPTRQYQLAQELGALAVVPMSLTHMIVHQLHIGKLSAATKLLEQLTAVCAATGSRTPSYASVCYESWRGSEADHGELRRRLSRDMSDRGEGIGLTHLEWWSAALFNGLGKYEDAAAVSLSASRYPDELQHPMRIHELVEAAVRSGRREVAEQTAAQLSAIARVAGSEWALGIEARSLALVSEGDAAESYYRAAIQHLRQTRSRIELARVHLIYGEWLRREGRRRDAREQLRIAHDHFVQMGTLAFAGRARRELLATGESARRQAFAARDELTAQEREIADLAAQRHSTRDIASQLFLSPRTVEWHLSKIYAKLGIRSRKQLATALSNAATSQPTPPVE